MRLNRWTKRTAVAAIAAVFVLTGSGVAFAAWVSGATVTSQVVTPKVSVTQAGFENLGFTFGNSALTSTGSFTVKNTGTTPGDLTVLLNGAAPSDAALASAITVTAWATSGPANCSGTPANPVTGTWAATITIPAGNLDAGQTSAFCVRTSGSERSLLSSPSGSVTVTPQVTANLKVGGWSASDVAQATQKTQYVWPNAAMTPGDWYKIVNTLSGNCVDVNGGVATDGITVIQWPCKTSGIENQRWQFVPTEDNYYRLATESSSAVELALVGATAGDIASVRTVDLSTQTQQWQAQYQGSGHYQLVVRSTGMCLRSPGIAATTEFTQAICDGSTAQQFTAVADPIVVTAMTCTATKVKGTNDSVTYAWAPAAAVPYTWKVETLTGTEPAGSTGFTISAADVSGWTAGSHTITVSDSMGRLRHTGAVNIDSKGKISCG